MSANPVTRFTVKALLLVGLFLIADRSVAFVLKHGLYRYYGLDQPSAILLTGHSHTVLGIDKVALGQELGVPVAKFAVEGAGVVDRLAMLRYYLAVQSNSVRIIVYDVDAHTFTASGLSSGSYRLLMPFMGEHSVRDYVRKSCPSRVDYLVRRYVHSSRYGDLLISLALRGYLGRWDNLKRGQIDLEALKRSINAGNFRRIEVDTDTVQQFEQTLKFVRERGIMIVLAYIPTIDISNEAEPQQHAMVVARYRRYAERDPGVVFLNYNESLQRRHELFFDEVHLNPQGQREVTAMLADDLKKLLQSPNLAHRPRP